MTTQKPSAFSLFSPANDPFAKASEPRDPFAPAPREAPEDAPEGSYTYALVQSGPDVPAEECEVPVAAVEVMIRWGAAVLRVAELAPVRSFWVGEDEGPGPKCDVVLPAEELGARRLPLVLAEGGAVLVVIPAGATGTIRLAGAPDKGLKQAIAEGIAVPCATVAGAHQVALPAGARAEIRLNGLSFQVSAGNAGKRAGRFHLRGEALPYQGLSLLLHAALLGATALFVPSLAMAKEEGLDEQQTYELAQMLTVDALREPDKSEELAAENQKPGDHGDVGQASRGEAGSAGSAASRDHNLRFAVEGRGPDTFLSRAEAMRQAQAFGMVGLLNSLNGSMGSPTSPFGRELASGVDPTSAKGNLFGESIGDAAGSGGLHLSGIGESGGGDGEGIGLDRIGTVGHDFVGGGGHSTGILAGVHKVRSPTVARMGTPIASGRLPPDVIQRVVRQNFGRFKACYENGLRTSPNLQGRVAVRFVIGHGGAVESAQNGGSDLPDAGVVSCVTRAFYGLSFPQPESGIVTVTYPIVFSPAN